MAEKDKYQEALSKYNTNLNDTEITKAVEEILAKNFDKNNNVETYKKIFSCIDLTTLSPTDNRESVWKFTQQVNDFEGDSDIPNVAAICVFPNMVEVVKEALTADVKIASVSGGFPASQTFLEIKIAETAMAIASGADEIDIVINVGYLLSESYQEMSEEISELKDACGDITLKVILETGELKTASNIMKASVLSLYSGAEFLKTSTGKTSTGATLEACYVMCQAIKQYAEKTGIKAGFKASGGISTTEEAVKYYTIVKEILGEECANNQYFRIGASRLVSDLKAKIN